MPGIDNILIIKLGALGDFIQALGPMAAIRRYHPHAKITLLTTLPFENFAQDCGYFDHILIDDKPSLFDIRGWLYLRQKLNVKKFTRVYDLQNNDRSNFYFKLFFPKPEWVGTAKGASHRNNSPARIQGHAFDGHVQTLARAGVTEIEIDTLSWMRANISSFPVKKPYVLLAPGAAPQHPYKCWPAEKYGRLAKILVAANFQPVVLGTENESDIAQKILALCPKTLDLTQQTSLAQIAVLAQGAAAAIGNDTGPLHLIAATGCPVLALFSSHSDPIKHSPKGAHVEILQSNDLEDLSVEEVMKNFMLREMLFKKHETIH